MVTLRAVTALAVVFAITPLEFATAFTDTMELNANIRPYWVKYFRSCVVFVYVVVYIIYPVFLTRLRALGCNAPFNKI